VETLKLVARAIEADLKLAHGVVIEFHAPVRDPQIEARLVVVFRQGFGDARLEVFEDRCDAFVFGRGLGPCCGALLFLALVFFFDCLAQFSCEVE